MSAVSLFNLFKGCQVIHPFGEKSICCGGFGKRSTGTALVLAAGFTGENPVQCCLSTAACSVLWL